MFSRGQVYRLLAVISYYCFGPQISLALLAFAEDLFPMMVIPYFPFGYGLLLWDHDYSIVSPGERFV